MTNDEVTDERAAEAGRRLRIAYARPAPPIAPVVARARVRRRRRLAVGAVGGFAAVLLLGSAAVAVVADRDDGGSNVATAGEVTADATTAPPTTFGTPVTTLPTPPDTHVPSEVRVIVVNGSAVRGVAGDPTNRLVPAGYATLPPADADRSDHPASFVYFRDGYEADAREVARLLGRPGDDDVDARLQPMPEPEPVRGTNGVANADLAHVLVLMGTDAAFTS